MSRSGPPPRDAARELHVHVDEVVLHGFPAADRYEIAAALERDLALLLEAPEVQAALAPGDVTLPRVDAGSFDVAAHERADAVGGGIARALGDTVARAGRQDGEVAR